MTTTWTPSPNQVKFVRALFAERVPNDYPNRQQWWDNIRRVSSDASLTTVIKELKAMPVVSTPKSVQPPTPPVLPELAKEDGLYRDPSDGTLYRLHTPKAKHNWDRPSTQVSVYSNKAVYRRLTPEGRMIKRGKWTKLGSYQARSLTSYSYAEKAGRRPVTNTKILKSWFLSDEEKLEWAVGTCLMCWKPLVDAVSVWNSIGPVCAEKWDVELQMPPEGS